jgi:hypothetical protein
MKFEGSGPWPSGIGLPEEIIRWNVRNREPLAIERWRGFFGPRSEQVGWWTGSLPQTAFIAVENRPPSGADSWSGRVSLFVGDRLLKRRTQMIAFLNVGCTSGRKGLSRPLLAGVMLLVSSWSSAANAASITVWGTGLADNGQLVAAGTVDPHYSIIQAPSPYSTPIAPRVTSNNPTYFPWADNTPTSQWINPSGHGLDLLPAGYYYYQTTFDLTGYNPATAQIVGNLAIDNALEVYLNGNYTGVSLPWAASSESPLHPFSITTGFVGGLNSLVFEVYNGPQPGGNPANPTGLQVQITAATAALSVPVPLPSAAWAGMGLLGGMLVFRRVRCRLITWVS